MTTSLEKVTERLGQVVGVEHVRERGRGRYRDRVPVDYRNVMRWCVSGQATYPPTWRSLHDALEKLNLEELSHEIEEYLSCELYKLEM